MNNTHVWWYPWAIALFFFDICANAFFERHFFALILGAYALQLYQPTYKGRIGLLALFACLEALIWYGSALLQLVVLIPLALTAHLLQQALYTKDYQKYSLAAAGLLGNHIIIEYLVLGAPLALPYTIIKIIGNILILWCFSLK